MSLLFKLSEKIYNVLKTHGPILIIIISLILLFNLFWSIVFFLLIFTEVEIPIIFIYLSTILLISNIFFMIKLFLLKKWAFYGYLISSFVLFLINFYLEKNIFSALNDLLLPMLLLIFFLPKRNNFN